MAGMEGGEGGFRSEPNVIPMIDILLVLLIIFMMTIAQTRAAMDIQLPVEQEQQPQDQQAPPDQIVLELGEQPGSYAINSRPVTLAQLDGAIHAIFDNRPRKLMFIKTARTRRYQDVITAMDIARGAGVQVLGFTPPEQAGGS